MFTKILHLYIARHEQKRKPYDGEHERINPSDNVRERRTKIKGKSRTHIRRKERKNPYIGGQKRKQKNKAQRNGKVHISEDKRDNENTRHEGKERERKERERAHLP